MQKNTVSLEDIRKNPEIQGLIKGANEQLKALGYTEHGTRHATIVSNSAKYIISSICKDERMAELAAIAGYIHDIGNSVNRRGHGEISGGMVYAILNNMGMDVNEAVQIIGAVGNHEEVIGSPISAIAAALIIADKADVHHSRVQNQNPMTFDIHDRVNYSVQDAQLKVDNNEKEIRLELVTDEESATLMEYFEIFLQRMLISRRAADYFGYKFKLKINGTDM